MRFSNSKISCFKNCRRMYELSYVKMLKPLKTSDALVVGKSYHEKLEQIVSTGDFVRTGDKTDAMADAWNTYVKPHLDLELAESWFDIDIEGKHLVGKIDALEADGTPVEHKTTSDTLDSDYMHRLFWDEQITTYLMVCGRTEMRYTVIRKPSIRLKKNETEEEFVQRCREWYDEDTDSKITTFKVYRSPEEIAEHRKEFVALANEMENCQLFYRNPRACSIYGCDYSSICLSAVPEDDSIHFEKKVQEYNVEEN